MDGKKVNSGLGQNLIRERKSALINSDKGIVN